ncbi:hypothetical protein E1B28_002546 [Marasmius oreades]|uniref:Uncharacterized protein n=1 Tax=Marasmius oreades TaxID=181124 RepID=A0A9P7RNV9_9AGAR|nr:uncharacterized protein E1B28_002546 [Marasmius oreades]KAG7086601.1 hypothetical protein E1B28_002546 [Marasmius oreades]
MFSSASSKENPDEVLKNFVSKTPNTRYTFDSERDAPVSEICRENGPQSRECIQIRMNSKRMFEAMQSLGFFCALPIDPGKTYMECKPLPK